MRRVEREVVGGLRLAIDGVEGEDAGNKSCRMSQERLVTYSLTQASQDREEGGVKTRSM